MMEFFTSNLASGIFGAVLGSLLANWLTNRNERTRLTMEFHKEWNNYEMSVQRRFAYHCVKAYPDIKYSDLAIWDENGSLSLFAVLRFYERLWHCFDTNRVDKQLAATLFYQNFYWWYFISFSTSLKSSKDDWPAYKDIENLRIKFREYTSEADYQVYAKKYTKKYNDYVSAKPVPVVQPNVKTTNAITINGKGNFVIS